MDATHETAVGEEPPGQGGGGEMSGGLGPGRRRVERRRQRRASPPMRRAAISAMHVARNATLREAVETIDRSGRVSLALLVDDQGRLIATITDGDIRRAILAGLTMDSPVTELLPLKSRIPNREPVTASAEVDLSLALSRMQERRVRQLPLLDKYGHVVDILLLADLIPKPPDAPRAVIMAGGFGMRLRPLTDDIPKPMLRVGGRPLIERIVGQLRQSGIDQIVVTTHYKPQSIVDHFGDGTSFGVEMTYIQEDEPLGTGGSLGLLEGVTEPLLVVNGDILTQVDFRLLLEFHRDSGADLTVGVRSYSFSVPFGVVEHDGVRIVRIDEKPEIGLFVNAGIYVMEPSVLSHVESGVSLSMTDLIQRSIEAGLNVVSFPVLEYWMDIGRVDDYRQAEADASTEVPGAPLQQHPREA